MIAEKYEMELYACDDQFNEHLKFISELKHPGMYKVSKMKPNETFYTRSINEQLEVYIKSFKSFKEDFEFVINDLIAIGNKPIVVEGNQLLPSLVFHFLNEGQNAIWIVPTEEFQRKYYQKRDWMKDVLSYTDNPAIAFENWMTRDALFAKFVFQQANDLELNTLQVDDTKDLEENFQFIQRLFRLS
jgi:hypothetical protein